MIRRDSIHRETTETRTLLAKSVTHAALTCGGAGQLLPLVTAFDHPLSPQGLAQCRAFNAEWKFACETTWDVQPKCIAAAAATPRTDAGTGHPRYNGVATAVGALPGDGASSIGMGSKSVLGGSSTDVDNTVTKLPGHCKAGATSLQGTGSNSPYSTASSRKEIESDLQRVERMDRDGVSLVRDANAGSGVTTANASVMAPRAAEDGLWEEFVNADAVFCSPLTRAVQTAMVRVLWACCNMDSERDVTISVATLIVM